MRYLLGVLILLSAAVYGLDCEYTFDETYLSKEMALVLENTMIKKGDLLNISDFTSGEQSTFTIYNPNNFAIFAILSYNVTGHSAGYYDKGFKVAPSDHSIYKHYCYDGATVGNCSIVPESVKYKVAQPEILEIREITVERTRPACKLCGNTVCLNNGASCDPLFDDLKCGSGICNIAGFCGTEKIVECSLGKTNCNNQLCLEPSKRELGESYKCEWECKSNAGKNGTCVKNDLTIMRETRTDLTISGVIIALLILTFSVILVKFLFKPLYELKKIRDELKKETEVLEKRKEKSSQELDFIRNKIKTEENDYYYRSKQLKEEIKNSEGKAKETLQNALSDLEGKNKDRIKWLKQQAEEIEIKTADFERQKKELEEQSYDLEIKKKLDEYRREYNDKIIYEDGYFKFKNSGKYVHNYIYKNKYNLPVPYGYEIHHIDKNTLNDKIWNLIALPKEKHNSKYSSSLDHSKIKSRDWNSGILQLRIQLGMTDKDFHKHILEHIKSQNK